MLGTSPALYIINKFRKEVAKMKNNTLKRKTVTPQDAAEIYGLSVGTLANLRCKKTGPEYHFCGRRIYYRVEELEAWLFQNRVLTIDSINKNN